MELVILIAVVLLASFLESMVSTLFFRDVPKSKEGKIDEALEDRFARIEMDRDAPEFAPS